MAQADCLGAVFMKARTMRYNDIKLPFRPPHSHHHTTTARIDPADHRRIEQFIDNDPALRLLGTENSQPDEWTVHVGCASERVRSNFDHWVYRTF
jgi:hypothetical protein